MLETVKDPPVPNKRDQGGPPTVPQLIETIKAMELERTEQKRENETYFQLGREIEREAAEVQT